MKYRAEIDGLRALAVIPVILFHAGFTLFSGGFVGVDVFFVISGYLITTILVDDLSNNRFSLLDFYERRARRILPALFFVMLVCIPVAWIWMIPSQMENFSQSLVAVSVFGSNILFWLTSGYFAAAAEEKPLLHTWSLAVEEQFYLLFPLFLLLAWRFGKDRVFWMISLMAFASLMLTQLGLRNDSSANFYLAPFRAWELLAGSMAALLVRERGVQTSNILAVIGVGLIFYSIFAFNELTPFPSFYTLIPVVGVVLVVMYGSGETFVSKLLSLRAIVGTGLVSYSAYLWHQPFFAFGKIIRLGDDYVIALGLIGLSFLMAYLSWRFIEKPFRNKGLVKRFWVFSLTAVCMVFFITFGLVGHFNNGFKDRPWVGALDIADRLLPDDPDQNRRCSEYYEIGSPVRFCRMSEELVPRIAIIGDSEGAALYQGLAERLNDSNLGLTMVGGRLFTNISAYPRGSAREKGFSEGGAIATKTIAAHEEITTVVVVSRGPFYMYGDWEFYLNEDPAEVDRDIVMEKGLRDVMERLKNKRDIIFVLDPPKLGVNPEQCYPRPFVSASPCVTDAKEYFALHKTYREIVSRVLAEYPNAQIFDPAELLCDTMFCYGAIGGRVLYGDPGHLNFAGATLISDKLAPILVEKASRGNNGLPITDASMK